LAVPTLPIDLIDNQKRGFTLPINQWMRRAEFLGSQTSTQKVWDKLGLDGEVVRHINKEMQLNDKGSAWLRGWQLMVLNKWAS